MLTSADPNLILNFNFRESWDIAIGVEKPPERHLDDPLGLSL